MATIDTEQPVAVAVVDAIHTGDLVALTRLLAEHPGLATARLGDDDPDGMSRTLLHVVTDWPGHFPQGAATVAVLVEAGADVNGRFRGPHVETPLHWAASSDDVAVLDALIDAGADLEAPGSVIGDGPPLANARAFAQWTAAHRLVQRGAATTLVDAATLGLLDRLDGYFAHAGNWPEQAALDRAFWGACHGGQGMRARRSSCWPGARTPTGCRTRRTAPRWTQRSGAEPRSSSAGCVAAAPGRSPSWAEAASVSLHRRQGGGRGSPAPARRTASAPRRHGRRPG